MKSGIFASLDIGTTSIKVIVAEVDNNQLNIIGVGNAPTNGVSRGMIVDIEETVESIEKAVKQAEEQSGVSIKSVVVGLLPNNVHMDHCYGSVSVDDPEKEITVKDVRAVIDRATGNILPNDVEIIAVHAHEFIVDGFEGIQDPRGMIGKRLEMDGTVTSIPRSVLHNIRKSVERAGLMIRQFVLYPEATGQLALSDDERMFGTVLIDLGGGQTTASAIHDNEVKFTKVVDEGGEYVTQDISIVLNTSVKNAEQLKKEVGQAYYELANGDRVIQVEVVGQKEPISVRETYISEIIEARMLQIFDQLKAALDEIEALKLPGGIVISGGSSSLAGVEALMESHFNVRVKKYIPDYMGVRYPMYSNAISLAYYTSQQSEIQLLINLIIADKLGLGQVSADIVPAEHIDLSHGSQSQSSDKQEVRKADKVKKEKSSEKMTDAIKDFFAGFFE